MVKKAAYVLAVLVGGFGLLTFGGQPAPAASFPDHAVTWIVPYSPGGGFDVWSRGVAAIMQKKLGQPVVIKNMPGAGGRTALNFLYRSRPDGYTIGIANVPGHVVTEMVKKTEYNINKFTWLGRIAQERYVLAVSAKSKFKTLADCQHSQRPMRISGTGPSATASIVGLLASESLGIPIVNVFGFKGTSTEVPALMRGDTDGIYRIISSLLPYLQSGQLHAVFTLAEKRSPSLPDVPSIAELGHPDLATLGIQRPIAAPPGVPADRAEILQNALMSTLKDPEFLAWAKKANREHEVAPLNGEQTRELLAKIEKQFKSSEPEIRKLFANPTAVFK